MIELISHIESADFRFVVNQAPGLRMFKRLVEADAAFQKLSEYITEDEDYGLQVLERVHNLTLLKVDIRYERPHDTALATYLLALEAGKSKFSRVASFLVSSVTNLWWASHIAHEILTTDWKEKPESDTQFAIFTIPQFDNAQVHVVYRTSPKEAGDMLILHRYTSAEKPKAFLDIEGIIGNAGSALSPLISYTDHQYSGFVKNDREDSALTVDQEFALP